MKINRTLWILVLVCVTDAMGFGVLIALGLYFEAKELMLLVEKITDKYLSVDNRNSSFAVQKRTKPQSLEL